MINTFRTNSLSAYCWRPIVSFKGAVQRCGAELAPKTVLCMKIKHDGKNTLFYKKLYVYIEVLLRKCFIIFFGKALWSTVFIKASSLTVNPSHIHHDVTPFRASTFPSHDWERLYMAVTYFFCWVKAVTRQKRTLLSEKLKEASFLAQMLCRGSQPRLLHVTKHAEHNILVLK